jgi:hypothetical protein
MENAKRDDNYVTTLLGVDMTTGLVPTKVYVDETTHRLLVSAVITSDTSAPSTSSVTSVGDTTSNVELLAANTSRKEAIITNDSTAVLYVAFGETATATNFTARLEQYGYVITQYKGQINGIWASDAGGEARITELT